MRPPGLGLYVHLPFCASRCGYCDFSVVTDKDDRQSDYLQRLIRELDHHGEEMDRPFATIFFGGGTPSRFALQLWEQLFEGIRARYGLEDNVEITCEANPESLTAEVLSAWKELGVNRISLGVQSFSNRRLATLDRRHDANEARLAVADIRGAGFENWSLDLIYGLPGQSVEEWAADLEHALALDPPHLSFYNLILHPGLPVTLQAESASEDDREERHSRMFLETVDRLEERRRHVYELSNAALPGAECRHNLLYWRGGEWIGIGLSAASFFEGRYFSNPASWDAYGEKWGERKVRRGETASNDEASNNLALDTLMLRLRTAEGIKHEDLAMIGTPTKKFWRLREELELNGYLRATPKALALSPKGWLLHSEITRRVLDSLEVS